MLAIAESVRTRGLKLTITTDGTIVSFEPFLRALGLADLFLVRVTHEDVSRGKPAPDLFLLALDRLGVTAEEASVYEDSDEGLQAALAAGIDALDVHPLVGPERLANQLGIFVFLHSHEQRRVISPLLRPQVVLALDAIC